MTVMNVSYDSSTGNYNYIVTYPASISKVPMYSTAISMPMYIASKQ